MTATAFAGPTNSILVEWFDGLATQQRCFPAAALDKQERWQLGWRTAR